MRNAEPSEMLKKMGAARETAKKTPR